MTNDKQKRELAELLLKLSVPIEYKDSYYFLLVSETRAWYSDLEGNGLDLFAYDVAVGKNLLDALKRLDEMRDKMLEEINNDKR